MITRLPRRFLQEQLNKLRRISYNRYYWWRRYESKHELPKKYPLYEKIVNGDYDPSSYIYQAQMELHTLEDSLKSVNHPDDAHEIRSLSMERYRRLIEDYEREESKRTKSLVSDFCKTFGLERKSLLEFMQDFDGTLLEMYQHYKLVTQK